MFISKWAKRFQRRAWRTKSSAMQLKQTSSSSTSKLTRCLGPFDLIMIGIGGIIGSGVFVLTGVASREHAGPAVVLSYSIAAISALLSGLCYTEFVVDLPTAGGAFNYISVVFGEFTAWIVACNMILEYTLSSAAIARGFSAYLATLAGLDPTYFIIDVGIVHLDFFALGLIIFLSCILAYGTKESARFNMIVTMINLAVVVFVVCGGLPYANPRNLKPFAPYGASGIFAAASIVFFSFIGFDTVATTAEEVKNPAVDLPIGIVGSLLVCGFLYALMCIVISLMVPYAQIDINAPFSQAFGHILQQSNNPGAPKRIFLGLAQRVVSIGALTGIVTSLLVALLGQARIYVVLGREWLLPSWFAWAHPSRGTPMHAAAFTCLTAGTLALLVDISTLAQLVSIGTLFVFFMVDFGVLVRRFCKPDTTGWAAFLWRALPMLLFNIGFTISFRLGAPVAVYVVFAALWVVAAAALLMLPVVWRPEGFAVPLSPITPALGMFVTLHLIGSLGWKSYVRFCIWAAASIVVYILYSMHRADAKDLEDERMAELASATNGTDATGGPEIELINSNRPPSPGPHDDGHTSNLWAAEYSDEDDNHRRGTSNLLKDTVSSDNPSFLLGGEHSPPDPSLAAAAPPQGAPGSGAPREAAEQQRQRNNSSQALHGFDAVDLDQTAPGRTNRNT